MSRPAMRLPAWLPWLALAALLALAPALAPSRFALSLFSQMGIAIILCLSYWLLMGQGGLLSFGHALFSGAGAFWAIHTLRWMESGWPLPVALLPLGGGVAAALLALPLGWLATRHTPTVFAMITLGLGELAWALALMFPAVFGGESGISADRTASVAWGFSLGPPLNLCALVSAYTLACALAIFGYTRSPAGQLLQAVRDNPERVAFIGHDPRRVRWLAFVVAAFFAGVSGGLSALLHEIVTTEVLASERSAAVLVYTFLGGSSSFLGPFLGGVLMVLGQVLLSSWTPAWLLYLGLFFLFMVMASPGGMAGWVLGPRRRLSVLQRLGLALSLLLALLGTAVLIEMAYQLRLADTLGSVREWGGLSLDAHAPGHWWAAAGLAMFSGLVWLRLRQRWLPRPA